MPPRRRESGTLHELAQPKRHPMARGGTPRATVLLSTRLGGVSPGPFESLNLGHPHRGRPRENVTAEPDAAGGRARLRSRIGVDGPTGSRSGHRLTREEVPGAYSTPGTEPPPEADGQLSNEKQRPLLVLVADCLPVAMLGDGGLGMLHCGWRGLAGGIVDEAAAKDRRHGASRSVPESAHAASRWAPKFEAAFADLGPGLMNGRNLDLPEAAHRLLRRAGVERIESSGIWTWCDERFFSHRRDGGITGRQAGIAWLN